MKILFIGGTGNISGAVSREVLSQGIDLYHLNRGQSNQMEGVHVLQADINDPEQVGRALQNHTWDAVVNWIAFTPVDVERDLEYFRGRTGQYIFISSASCYQKNGHYLITESTPLYNPLWDYSQQKIASEDRLMQAYRTEEFPFTVVRPSHTYETVIPIPVGGFREFTTARRMLDGKEVIVPGDGTSLWTVTHAEDFARAFVGLLGNPQTIGHAFHITSDEALTWNQIYQILGDALGVSPHIVHIPSDFICNVEPSFTGTLLADKAHSALFDNTKIKRYVPGWQATIPFYRGIRRTIDWMLGDPSRQWVNTEKDHQIENILQQFPH